MGQKNSPGKGVVQRPVVDRTEWERKWDQIFNKADECQSQETRPAISSED
jgi:hypothetical protein